MKLAFGAFETALHAELHAALARFAKAHRKPRFYAVALHGVYRELEGDLCLPFLAASSEEEGPPLENPSSFWGARFNPPDWPFVEIPLRSRPAARLARELTAEATRGSEAHWRATEAKYFQILVRITRRLRDAAPRLLNVTEDFVCFWHDEEGGPELAGKSIARRQYDRLFAKEATHGQELRQLADKPPEDRAAFLVTRFGIFEGVTSEDASEELFRMGPNAIDALVTALSDPQHGWQAAMLLGKIGISTPDVVHALRAQAAKHWYAMALGMLVDHAWLAKQAPEITIQGLLARLKAITQGGPRHPLDYVPLETYLDAVPGARKLAEAELAPGSSYAAIETSDVDEGVRGLASKHAVVRWHAASVLGERRLGSVAGKRILPALAAVLGDRNALVRRLAVLSLSYWKTAARPYYPAIRAMSDDSDLVVRSVAARTPSK